MPVDPLTGDDDDVTLLPTPLSKRGFDLHTPEGRRRAFKQLTYDDQGFLRAKFRNFHWVTPEMARANQPSPGRIAEYAGMGFKTIINLRGFNDSGYYLLEREACKAHGLALIDAPFGAREPPYKDRLLRVARLFEEIRYPALMHCKSGADRAGMLSVLYLHLHCKQPLPQALAQLSLKYLHIRQSKTGMLDYFFERYLAESDGGQLPFLDWVRDVYDPAAVRAGFMGQWWANVLVDKLLRRE
ncbi:MAG: sulfur transferase domain-containing protein [Gammaproteobacteria bacterium]|nr:sulfur transferase domain-containing protein [Gammaproteobacteria bacterium]